jgi:ATP-dependent RNA helicase DDX35
VALLRAGRAGCRTAGQCYRLYSLEAFENLPEDSPPAMQTSALASAVLYLKLLEVPDVRRIDFMSQPTDAQLLQVGACPAC